MATENNEVYQHNSICDVECDEYVKVECIVYSDAIDYLGLEEGSSTKEIIDKLTQTVEFLQQQINTLEARVTTLETP